MAQVLLVRLKASYCPILDLITKSRGEMYMFDMESIGLKISQLRKARNMTQMELADQLNISFQAYLELGKRRPPCPISQNYLN